MAKLPKYYKIHTDGHTVELEPIYTDLVPVVQCKDCEHGEIDDPDFPYHYYCHMGHMWNDAYHFCADGEWKVDRNEH